MGLKILPNHAIHFYLNAEKFMLCNNYGVANPFKYETVHFNLAVLADYNPNLPCFIFYESVG